MIDFVSRDEISDNSAGLCISKVHVDFDAGNKFINKLLPPSME